MQSARIDEKVDFMAEKTQIAHEATAFARENEHPSASRFPQRRQVDELDEIDLFIEKRRRLNEWCVQNDESSELNSQSWTELIVPPPSEFKDPLPVPILIARARMPVPMPASMPTPMPAPHLRVEMASLVRSAAPQPTTIGPGHENKTKES